jgi:hypothetical protein
MRFKLLVVVALALTLVLGACSTSVSGGGFDKSCASIVVDTSYGRAVAQQPYSQGFIQWGVQPKIEYNSITVNVYVNGTRYDSKTQTYDPHGSISPVAFKPGAHIEINGSAVDTQGTLYFDLKCHAM